VFRQTSPALSLFPRPLPPGVINTGAYGKNMGLQEKLSILAGASKYDICSTAGTRKTPWGNVCHSYTPDGRCVSLFKILQTNVCNMECMYCVNPVARRKASFSPEEMARVFFSLYRQNVVDGLFLSSGIPGDPEDAMENTLETVGLLRKKHGFRGYIHLKILPGATLDQIRRGAEMADRLSVNMEAPSGTHLSEIAPQKDFKNDILLRQRWIYEVIGVKKRNGHREVGRVGGGGVVSGGQTTQLVVGASDETDREILSQVYYAVRYRRMRRVYFSPFTPIPGTGLEKHPPAPRWRARRLYQVEHLIRLYGYEKRELLPLFEGGDMLPDVDPKVLLAMKTFDGPVDINEADYSTLIRVPGIGPRTARRILALRENGGRVRSMRELQNMGCVVKRARPFVLLPGRNYQAALDRWAT